MARGFGSTLGSGTTDNLLASVTAHYSQMSFALWVYRNGDGGSSAGRMFQKGSAITLFNTGTNYQFQHQWTTQNGNWNIARPAVSEWHHIGVSYDSGLTSNDPLMYLDGVSQSVSKTLAPSGTLGTNASQYRVGNRDGNDRNWDGSLAWKAIWNVLLAADEFLALGKGVCPLVIRPTSLVDFLPLAGSTTHSWVSGAATTVTGTAVQPDAFPHHYPARRRRIYIPGAGTIHSVERVEAASAADVSDGTVPGVGRSSLIGGKLMNSLLLGGLVR